MKMIKLKNGYGIVSDGKSYTLVQDAIQKSKDGVETEIKKQNGKGHFKGIDTITPIREILDNCKVV